ncbi:hypothetical protein VTL71DRAFT_8358 [Oculimacula yallundae]|uniref:Uncharacterized protein n=1 Tax=Oculimacula yallundae TaxID=86028 RepID=A0ABR4CXG3_9HELO
MLKASRSCPALPSLVSGLVRKLIRYSSRRLGCSFGVKFLRKDLETPEIVGSDHVQADPSLCVRGFHSYSFRIAKEQGIVDELGELFCPRYCSAVCLSVFLGVSFTLSSSLHIQKIANARSNQALRHAEI